jgi:hypothetical protein
VSTPTTLELPDGVRRGTIHTGRGSFAALEACIPAAAHSPAVEAPATTAAALTRFWDEAEIAPAQTA